MIRNNIVSRISKERSLDVFGLVKDLAYATTNSASTLPPRNLSVYGGVCMILEFGALYMCVWKVCLGRRLPMVYQNEFMRIYIRQIRAHFAGPLSFVDCLYVFI